MTEGSDQDLGPMCPQQPLARLARPIIQLLFPPIVLPPRRQTENSMTRRALTSLLLLTLFATSLVAAQEQGAPALTAKTRGILIDSIASALNRMYVFPDVAAPMEADLRARVARGEFNAVSDQIGRAHV